ncbi:MAG: hypothetical protein HQ511_01365 [Rhodospirillales bacterium]|nr:hypothetical protein [Rhodospirillales bacterium]
MIILERFKPTASRRGRLALISVVLLGMLLPVTPVLGESPAYCLVPGWPRISDEVDLGQVAGVGIGTDDTVYVFHRGNKNWGGGGRLWSRALGFTRFWLPEWLTGYEAEGPVRENTLLALDPKTGVVLSAIGADQFLVPHGLTLDAEDNLWVTDVGLHQVFKVSRTGEVLLTIGARGVAGNDQNHFDRPTDVAVAGDGSFYVADGYGNARVVKFSPDGDYLFEWGGRGTGPGQFDVPHGIAISAAGDDEGKLYVADRGNARVQVFDLKGQFIKQISGPEIGRPWAVDVAEDGRIFLADGGDQDTDAPRSGLVILTPDGVPMARWSEFGYGAGNLVWPHDLAVSRKDEVYVGEVLDSRRLQKFSVTCAGDQPK